MTDQPKQIELSEMSDLEFANLWANQKDLLYQALQNAPILQAEYERRKTLIEKKKESEN